MPVPKQKSSKEIIPVVDCIFVIRMYDNRKNLQYGSSLDPSSNQTILPVKSLSHKTVYFTYLAVTLPADPKLFHVVPLVANNIMVRSGKRYCAILPMVRACLVSCFANAGV